MATPAEQDLVITKGDTVSVVVTMTSDGTTPINITGRTYSAKVRQTYRSPSASAEFVCTVTDGAAGEITMTMSAATTETLNNYNNQQTYVWDLQENASGVITTVLSGNFIVLPDVTW
jgi:hypothetical protein